MATTETPLNISVDDKALEELSQRLSLTKFPDQLQSTEGDNWPFGVPVDELKRLVNYWKDGFDWRAAERTINKLPNFEMKINVDGFDALDIHYVHQISPNKNATPLLFVHGWPGSFIEVTKLLPLLGDSFHVVAPSLPNYGFSSGVTRKGFTLDKYAETVHKLMLKLGYDQYVTQAGDWGYGITRAVGLLYPQHCKASHFNMNLGLPPQWKKNPLLALQHAFTPYSEREKRGLERSKWFMKEAFGYNLLQSTKPQTIGFALSDSPAALLAWIYEKLHDWTDSYPWTDDEILTWVSIYWFSKAGPEASVRIYHEATHPQPQSSISTTSLREWIPHVKIGIAHFPREISITPSTWASTLGPVVYESEYAKGGHFAAWEAPEAISTDLHNMFGKGGPCYRLVATKSRL